MKKIAIAVLLLMALPVAAIGGEREDFPNHHGKKAITIVVNDLAKHLDGGSVKVYACYKNKARFEYHCKISLKLPGNIRCSANVYVVADKRIWFVRYRQFRCH
jgi:hypothetical protein